MNALLFIAQRSINNKEKKGYYMHLQSGIRFPKSVLCCYNKTPETEQEVPLAHGFGSLELRTV